MERLEAESGPESGAETGPRELLRFLTCGSVDDGKSTLIGRLLFETGNVPTDELSAARRDTRRLAGGATRTDGDLDFALLVDGLEAEREQGITIDVAYRFFSTRRRSYIVADTPGHRQYTRNMATGASRADLALLLVDARHGVLEQTRRHAFIVRLMGIRQVILAVNKMDLVGYEEAAFRAVRDEFSALAARLGATSVTTIPVAAAFGENLVRPSAAMPWYDGPSVLEALDAAAADNARPDGPLRFPVQWVNRPTQAFRGYCGTIAAGRLAVGETLTVARTGAEARIDAILVGEASVREASAGDAVTLTLDQEIDLSRGDMLVPPNARPHVADQFAAHLLWMNEQPLLPGRSYLIRAGTFTGTATVTELKHVVDVETGAETAAKTLDMNAVGFVNISAGSPFAFDPFDDCPGTGGFILIDRFTNETVAAGMIRFALRRADNIHWQSLAVSKATRSRLKLQKPAMLWFTGLSGAGKSTIADLVERRLVAADRHTYLLDGDNIRHGLNRDLGFTDADRVENIRRVSEVGRLFVDAGLITLVSFISPFRAERLIARERLEEGEFVEIFVDAPIETCEARDPKGLYTRARAGGLANFTGIDSPYEPPLQPEIHLRADRSDPSTLADEVLAYLRARGIV